MENPTLSSFYAGAMLHIQSFDAFVKKRMLIGRAQSDHICYKCNSLESFECIRTMLEGESDFIHQSIISKRRIAYIKLKQPFVTALGDIYFLELSDQKPDDSQKEGFDHIEVFPTAMLYEDFVTELSKSGTVVHVERPHHTTDDIELPGGFLFRCTTEPLIQKIIREEMGVRI